MVFVGLGNPMRRDDFAGLLMLQRLEESDLFSNAVYIAAGTNPENYLQKILEQKPRAVIFIDAARFSENPGDIKLLDRDTLDQACISTHAFSIQLVENYLRSELDMDVYYLGIQPEETGLGEGLTEVVSTSLDTFFQTTSKHNN